MVIVRSEAVRNYFGFAKGWPDVIPVIPPGWDAEAAARLQREYEIEQASNNALQTSFLPDWAREPQQEAKTGYDNATSGPIGMGSLRPVAPPPPPSEDGSTPSEAPEVAEEAPKFRKMPSQRKHQGSTKKR
jgi:hypothetical protein